MEIINSELEAESNESLKTVRETVHVGINWLDAYASPQRKTTANETSSTPPSVSLDAPYPFNCGLKDVKPSAREHVQLYEQIFGFFSRFVGLCGIGFNYHWTPYKSKSPVFWFIVFLMVLVWVCLFHTQRIRIENDEKIRLLEIWALFGVTFSVNLVQFLQRHLILEQFIHL